MRAVHPDAANTPVRIGAQLRSSRTSQGITIEQLAAACGLTKGFISRVERDETMPSVPTLVQICQALSLPIGALFTEPEVQRVELATAPRINMGGTNVDERLVTPRSEERLQLIRSSLAPHAHGGDGLYTVGSEIESLHVISGTVTVSFPASDEVLEAGDTITFPGRTPHTWRTDEHGAEMLWVLAPASWSGSA